MTQPFLGIITIPAFEAHLKTLVCMSVNNSIDWTLGYQSYTNQTVKSGSQYIHCSNGLNSPHFIPHNSLLWLWLVTMTDEQKNTVLLMQHNTLVNRNMINTVAGMLHHQLQRKRQGWISQKTSKMNFTIKWKEKNIYVCMFGRGVTIFKPNQKTPYTTHVPWYSHGVPNAPCCPGPLLRLTSLYLMSQN